MASALPLLLPVAVGESAQQQKQQQQQQPAKAASNANANPTAKAAEQNASSSGTGTGTGTGFGVSRLQMAHQNAPSGQTAAAAAAANVRVVRGRAYFERMPFDRDTREQLALRQEWWRSTLKDTPNPDAYPGATGPVEFAADLQKNPVQQTYRFLGDGRRRSLYAHLREGKVTPGRYLVSDSISEVLGKTPRTYGFKEKPRNDSQSDVAPPVGSYSTEKYEAISGDRLPISHASFKSGIRRFPTFRPRFGPSPAEYDARSSWESMSSSGAPMRSSFVSKTERFGSSSTISPGPGYYEKSHYYAAHMPSALKSLGRANGIFFAYSPDD